MYFSDKLSHPVPRLIRKLLKLSDESYKYPQHEALQKEIVAPKILGYINCTKLHTLN